MRRIRGLFIAEISVALMRGFAFCTKWRGKVYVFWPLTDAVTANMIIP